MKYRYRPFANILISSMQGQETDDFTAKNMTELVDGGLGIVLLQKDSIHVGSIDARWFTYTKVQYGVTRDMIAYIIPVRGFAYIMTCGTRNGTMGKYRPVFDRMARSFRDR